jgi:oxygen-independent coproporphyrinogen-3 oxidase
MEFSLYLHIPYCDSKCPYCDFNSHAARQWPEERYVAALRREMAVAAADPAWRGGRIGTIFFGGGTPSLFEPESIAVLLEDAGRLWAFSESPEITLEANPGTVDVARLRGFRAAGVNRLSFGVQSFQERFLRLLGRIHDGETAIRAVEDACRAGFDDVNVDLMFAVPGQTVGEWRADLSRAIDLGTTHVSAYNLTFEEGTAFTAMQRRGELQALDEETEIEMYGVTERTLAAAGFERYEISNYAKPGRVCRHNLQYWRLRPYLGVGAGAHSYAPPLRHSSNERGPEAYMRQVESDGAAVAWSETVSENQARGEFVFLGLRCRDGIEAREFVIRFGLEFTEAFPHSGALRDGGLLIEDGGRWCLTERGRMVSDEVFATFV